MTRFSILIPTRNRLEYLRHAVETVLRQSYGDWEIVIADNASADDVESYVRGLDEPRIVYSRSETFISVTDNWNRAQELSSGDYAIMLGDDDGLMRNSLRRFAETIEEFRQPDLVYVSTYKFAYPRALAEFPDGHLERYGYALFLRDRTKPFLLDRSTATELAHDATRFRARYGFNMQFAALSRRLIERLSIDGELYKSSFPDYFTMNAAFLEAERIAVIPEPLTIIGISPKSYGSYHAANQEASGNEFLASFPTSVPPRLEGVVLPGDSINNGWLFAMAELERVYGDKHGVRLDVARYRRVQMLAVARRSGEGTVDPETLRELRRRLNVTERFSFAIMRAGSMIGRIPALRPFRAMAAKLWHAVAARIGGGPTQFVPWSPGRIEGDYRNVVDVCERAPER